MKLFALIQTRDYRMWLEGRENESTKDLYKRMREEFPNAIVYIICGDYEVI